MENKRSIDLEDDPKFEELGYRIQRIGWVFMILIMLAGVLGLTGPGPLSERRFTNASGNISLEFNKYLHFNTPDQIQVLLSGTADDSDVMIMLERNFVRDIRLERIVPEPLSQETGEKFMIYHFKKSGNPGSVMLTLHINPVSYGSCETILRAAGEEMLISQFIFP